MKSALLLLFSILPVGISYANGCDVAFADSDTEKTSSFPRLTEAQLKQRGYRPIFTDGLDKAYKLMELADTLRQRNIDPTQTHIPEFAEMVPEHIAFIKEGLDTHKGEQIEERLLALNILTQQAQTRIQNKTVTYEWWIKFNYLLTLLPSAEGYHKAKEKGLIKMENNHSVIESLPYYLYYRDNDLVMIDDFTQDGDVFFPVIHRLGIITINTLFSHNIYPLEVINKPPYAFTDGFDNSSANYYLHDMAHFQVYRHYQDYGQHYSKIYKNNDTQQILRNNFPTSEEAEMQEMLFFMFIHEQYSLGKYKYASFNPFYPPDSSQKIRELNPLLPKRLQNASHEEIDNYIEKAEAVFKQHFVKEPNTEL